MKVLFRIGCLLVAICSVNARQVVQSDYFVVNAGLAKNFQEAANPAAIAFGSKGQLACIDKSGALSVLSESGETSISKSPAHAPGKAALAFSSTGELASWGADQKVLLWRPDKTLATSGGKPGILAFSGDGTRLACGGDDGTIRVFSVASGAQVSASKAHSKAILAMAFEPSGNTIVSVGGDRNLTITDAGSGQVVKQKFLPVKIRFDAKPEDEFQQIRSAGCTPDGSLFAVGGYSFYRQLGGLPVEYEFIVVYDRSGRRLLRINDPNSVNMSLCVSITSDGRLVGTSGPGGKMRIWDVQHREKCGEIANQGSIRMTAATKAGPNYLFAIAGNVASVVGITPNEAEARISTEPDKSAQDGLSIEFASPTEAAPIVSAPNLQVSALVTGLQGTPRYSIEVAGRQNAPATLEVSENKELVSAPAPTQPGSVGQAAAVKVSPQTVQISQNVTLSEGPNRIKVTVQDGSKLVTAVKTICFIPDGDQLSKEKVYSDSFAVVVGINKYAGKGGKNIPGLTAAVADAQDLAQVLKTQYGFKDVVVLTDAAATHEKVMAALNRLTDANLVKPNDRVVVFWSGHGQTVTAPEGGQIGFLLPSDAQVDFSNLDNIRPYRETCLPMDELARLARDIPAKHVLFLIDACFSGLAATTGSSNPPNTFSLVHEAYFDAKQIITASSRFEPAKEKNGHGYFTKALLEALQDPAADENKDGFLTASELYKYVLPKVQVLNSTQSPKMAKFSLGIGETLFFK